MASERARGGGGASGANGGDGDGGGGDVAPVNHHHHRQHHHQQQQQQRHHGGEQASVGKPPRGGTAGSGLGMTTTTTHSDVNAGYGRSTKHTRHESGGSWLFETRENLARQAAEEARAREGATSTSAVTEHDDRHARGVDIATVRDASVMVREDFDVGSPNGTGATGVLLDYFESLRYFDEWVAVSNLWERRENVGVSDYLCARLYRETSDEAVERYLSQIVTMWIQRTELGGAEAQQASSLERMMVMCCRRSLRLATKMCWLLSAAAEDSLRPAAVQEFRERCAYEAVTNGTWLAPFEERRASAASPASPKKSQVSTTGEEPVTPPRKIFGMAKSPAKSRGSDEKVASGDSPTTSGGFLAGFSRVLSFRSSPSSSKSEKAKKHRESRSPGKSKESPKPHGSGGRLSSLFAVCGTETLPPEDGAKELRLRKKTFDATMKFTDELCDLSDKLSKVFPLDNRQGILRHELAQINRQFRHTEKGTGVLFPMGHGKMERVIRIPFEEAVLLNSREKAPYLVCLEVVSSNPTQEEMDHASTHGSPNDSSEDFYPSGDDFMPDARERIRRSLEANRRFLAPVGGGDASTGSSRGTNSFSNDDLEDMWVNVVPIVNTDDNSIVVRLVVRSEAEMMDTSPGPHQRKPSEVGLIEMAAQVNARKWAPEKDALDVTSLPTATGVGASMTSSPHKRSAGGLGELWIDKLDRIRRASPYGNLPGWGLKPIIIKAGDNCRQELLALQLVRTFADIYRSAGVRCWIRDFDILTTNTHSALIEAVTDAPSIHALKSRSPRGMTLRQHFERKFGVGTPEFRKAQNNFVESLAGYSILTYLLQVKDRHNGNILLHDDGHLIHIDFNFMLSTSPGGINFESSPFKLTKEYLEVMDSDAEGTRSEAFDAYKALCIQGYLAVREHAERIVLLIQMMRASGCPCFNAGPKVMKLLRQRFNLAMSEEQCVETVLGMISDSIDAWSTRQYDFYQRYVCFDLLPSFKRALFSTLHVFCSCFIN